MGVEGPSVEDQARIEHDGNIAAVEAIDHLGHDVAAFQVFVLPANFGGIMEEAGVGLRGEGDGLNPGAEGGPHVLLGIEFGQELRIPIGDVHVYRATAPRADIPRRPAAIRGRGAAGNRGEEI